MKNIEKAIKPYTPKDANLQWSAIGLTLGAAAGTVFGLSDAGRRGTMAQRFGSGAVGVVVSGLFYNWFHRSALGAAFWSWGIGSGVARMATSVMPSTGEATWGRMRGSRRRALNRAPRRMAGFIPTMQMNGFIPTTQMNGFIPTAQQLV